MPRIATRTEPYTSPSRQHRHYKTKRDLILRSLGKASYINGCQFAITFISARGDMESFGSEMCSDRLGEIFNSTVVTEIAVNLQAVTLAKRERALQNGEASDCQKDSTVVTKKGKMEDSSARSDATSTPRVKTEAQDEVLTEQRDNESGEEEVASGEDSDGDGEEGEDVMEATQKSEAPVETRSLTPAPLKRQHTSLLMEAYLDSDQMGSMAGINMADLPKLAEAPSQTINPALCTPMRSNTSGSNQTFRTPGPFALHDTINPIGMMTPASNNPPDHMHQLGSAFVTPGLARSRSNTNSSTHPPATPLQASDTSATPLQLRSGTLIPSGRPDDLRAWYIAKFEELQQQTCKIIIKSWIKVIEPKKQTRYPYNRGEDGKPAWWPDHVRHKEPDHLVKQERIDLALTILQSHLIKVNKLEIATAEQLAFIPADKHKVLRELYKVAKDDERDRQPGQSVKSETPINSQQSTDTGLKSSVSAPSFSSVKSEYPATLPRASIRANLGGGSSGSPHRYGGQGCSSAHVTQSSQMGVVGNVKLPNGDDHPIKKRKLNQSASCGALSMLGNGNTQPMPDHENVPPSAMLFPAHVNSAPQSRPSSSRRSRLGKGSEPIPIGTVQLHDPHTNKPVGPGNENGLELNRVAPGMIALDASHGSLHGCPPPHPSPMDRPWSSHSWAGGSGSVHSPQGITSHHGPGTMNGHPGFPFYFEGGDMPAGPSHNQHPGMGHHPQSLGGSPAGSPWVMATPVTQPKPTHHPLQQSQPSSVQNAFSHVQYSGMMDQEGGNTSGVSYMIHNRGGMGAATRSMRRALGESRSLASNTTTNQNFAMAQPQSQNGACDRQQPPMVKPQQQDGLHQQMLLSNQNQVMDSFLNTDHMDN